MSLYIDVDRVNAVLLVDGWHKVADQSFSIDSYEMHWMDKVLLAGGREKGIPAAGFTFREVGSDVMCGPLTSILAITLCDEQDDD